jgi:phosphonate transport system substrate-binding protein
MEDWPAKNPESRLKPPSSRKSIWVLSLKTVLALILALGVVLGFYNVLKSTYLDRRISRFFPHNWVNLEETRNPGIGAVTNGDSANTVFRVAIAPIVSPKKSLEMYQGFIDYLAEKLGRKPESLYRLTYSETNDLVRYKRCDIAVVCTYPFIRGEKEFGMQALVVPRIRGETTYQSFIVVPPSSSARSILDLRGKRFASADIISTTGWLFPAMLLMDAGESPAHFFGEQIITGSHDRSIQAVIDGFVDGAAVHGIVYDQMAAEDPSINQKVKILIKSPPFGIPPVVAHPDMDPGLRKAVLAVLLDMHNNPKGKLILEKLQIEKFVVPEKGLFDNLRQAIKRLEGWK